jgi:hypothetical protein
MGNYVQGAQTRVYFGIMPAESLQLHEASGLLLPPPDVTVTLSGAAAIASAANIAAGFQMLAVNALTGPIANGTPLLFRSAALSFYAYLNGESKTGDTQLRVQPLEVAIPAGAVAAHKGIIQMVGGTAANLKIEAEDESMQVFTEKDLDDVSDELSGYMDGAVKSAKWSLDYESLSKASDITQDRMTFAGANATNGVKCYVRKLNQAPSGYRRGKGVEGHVSVLGYEETNPADGVIKIKCTLMGRGAPKITRPAMV